MSSGNKPLVTIRSKRLKGIDVAVWASTNRKTANVSPTDDYNISSRITYWSRNENRYVDKKTLFYAEALELARLFIVAVKWVCDDCNIPYPTAGDFALDDLDIKDSSSNGVLVNGREAEPQGTIDFVDDEGIFGGAVAYDEDEIV